MIARLGDREILSYRYSPEAPKTYIHPLTTPNGVVVTEDSPEDHRHHRGLFLGWSRVNGYDFWGEFGEENQGWIVQTHWDGLSTNDWVRWTVRLRWRAGGRTLLNERRSLAATVWDRGLFLEWTSVLSAPAEMVVLDASQHPYNGLGIRFVREMTKGDVLHSDGTSAIQEANGRSGEWCSYFREMDKDRVVGAALFSHPSSARHPCPFFVMNDPFGFISAAPTFHEPLTIATGQFVSLKFGIFVYDGVAEKERLNGVYQRWVGT
ncbi:MAG: PmoA family protein [Armatimonadetes bacterium]|nr:PmoA family protein [Armatimonadota bacterium]MDW8121618.1 PmoA family protein [Armatimonadota bacterium]